MRLKTGLNWPVFINLSSNYIEIVKSYQVVCPSTGTETKPLTPQHQESTHSRYCNDIGRVTFLRYIFQFTHRFLCPKNPNCYLSLGAEVTVLNPLNPELNPICYLLTLLAHHFLHVSRIMVKSLTLRLLMSYIYGVPILDVSRSHTTTQHSR